MRKILLINSFSGGAQALVSTILVFFTIPIFIHKLGTELYGVFSLLLLLGNLNIFINLGLSSSLLKYLSEQGKCIESNYDIIVSFIVLFIIVLPVTFLGLFFENFILRSVLNIPLHYVNSDLKALYICMLFSNSIQFVGQISSPVIDSQQKIYLTNILQVLYNYAYWALVLVSVFVFSNLRSIGFSILFVNITWFLAITIIAKKSWGPFRLNGLLPNFTRIARKQISYGSKLFASGIIGFFYEPITKILLSNFVGISEVGFFDIALRMRNQVWNLLTKLLYPFFPYLSHMNDMQKIRSTVHDLEKKILFITIPIIIGIMFISHTFIRYWIGKNVEVISISFIFIVAGYLIGVVVVPTYLFLMAKGHPGKTIIIQSINVFANGILFLMTFHFLGYYAVIVGNTGAILSSFLGCLYYQHKYLKTCLFDSINHVIKVMSLVAILSVSGYLLNSVFSPSLIKLVLFPVIFLILSLISFRFLHVFSENDIDKYLGASDKTSKMIIKKLLIQGT
jgi:O-antigen/teichoic acid export membrane protein